MTCVGKSPSNDKTFRRCCDRVVPKTPSSVATDSQGALRPVVTPSQNPAGRSQLPGTEARARLCAGVSIRDHRFDRRRASKRGQQTYLTR